MRCEELYFETYNRNPDSLAFCPYRISRLGAHIDHQFGKINGLAINRGVHIAYSKKRMAWLNCKASISQNVLSFTSNPSLKRKSATGRISQESGALC